MIAVSLSYRRHTGSRRRHYFLRYVNPATGRTVYESCRATDGKLAEEIRSKRFREINAMATEKSAPKPVTLDEVRDLSLQYMRNRDRAGGSLYLRERAFAHFTRFLTKRGCAPEAGGVTPETVEQFVAFRSESVKGRTINREVGDLRSAWNVAIKLKRLTTNPFNAFEKVDVDPVVVTLITVEEESRILASAAGDPEMTCWTRLLFDTGCRANEISHLRWQDLDLDNGIGKVETRSDWRSKTRRHRPIGFTGETTAALRQWQTQRKGQVLVFGDEDAGPRDHYRRMFDRFAAAVKSANIGRKITPQDCRRSMGTLLARRGVNQRVAAEILGHSSISTTSQYYQSVDPETVRTVILDVRRRTA